jgi:hypothetical protein
MAEDLDGTLAAVSNAGYTQVEAAAIAKEERTKDSCGTGRIQSALCQRTSSIR